MRIGLVASAVCSCLSGSLAAQEFGRIEASLNGEARTWYTLSLSDGERTDASATFSTGKLTSDLHLQAHPRPSFTTSDMLSIDLMFRGDYQPGDAPMDVEIMYLPSGMRPPFWTSARTGTPVSVAFEELAVDGDSGRAVGTFSATLCRTEVISDDPDTGQCQPIEGRFDTRLLVESR